LLELNELVEQFGKIRRFINNRFPKTNTRPRTLAWPAACSNILWTDQARLKFENSAWPGGRPARQQARLSPLEPIESEVVDREF